MGGLPICEARQSVEVVGTLSVSSKLMGSVYQIIDPTSVKCLTTARSGPSAAEPPAVAPPVEVTPPARAEAARADAPSAPARALGPSAWVGRYTDDRGTGEITFTLVRGESTVSGTWKMRTGGGGPVTGLAESRGGRLALRLENIAADCPGLLEGSAEITDTTFTATYHGHDCQGEVTGGRLELRPGGGRGTPTRTKNARGTEGELEDGVRSDTQSRGAPERAWMSEAAGVSVWEPRAK